MRGWMTCAAVFGAALTAGAAVAAAEPAKLDGSWSGGGRMTLPSGQTETARCRVSYQRAGGKSYTASASCATASGRIDQTAELERVSDNTFEGSFYNSQYGVSGSVRVVVSGSSQSVALSGGGGSANLRLSR